MARKTVNILVSHPYGPSWSSESLEQVKAVGRQIKLTDISDLVFAENTGDMTAKERLDELLREVEIYYGMLPPKDMVARSPGLKWIQTPLAGVDFFLKPEIIDSSITLTNARFHGTQIRELVFNLMLMLARQSYQHFCDQQQKKWQPLTPVLLNGKTIGILGMGNIGQAVARLSQAFDMKVLVMRARANIPYKYADETFGPEGLPEILVRADFLVIILPLTAETRKIIGEKELRMMKPTAFLINVARGGVIDEDALITALKENIIAGARLDVFATEPLPETSELWDLPSVIISPHNAGIRSDYYEIATAQFCKNLKRYLTGKELLNIVDKRKGY